MPSFQKEKARCCSVTVRVLGHQIDLQVYAAADSAGSLPILLLSLYVLYSFLLSVPSLHFSQTLTLKGTLSEDSQNE